MARTRRFGRDHGKASRHYDRDGDDIIPRGVVGIRTRFSNRGLVKMISVSSHSHIASRAGPSQVVDLEDDMYFDDLLYFDEEVDMTIDDTAVPKPNTPRCCSHHLRYLLG
nr:hypothetical protein CFP56_05661 [Quercus suber]